MNQLESLKSTLASTKQRLEQIESDERAFLQREAYAAILESVVVLTKEGESKGYSVVFEINQEGAKKVFVADFKIMRIESGAFSNRKYVLSLSLKNRCGEIISRPWGFLHKNEPVLNELLRALESELKGYV